MEYNIWADALNKFSQLTPWVQVSAMLCGAAIIATACYCTMRILISLTTRKTPVEVKEMVVYTEK